MPGDHKAVMVARKGSDTNKGDIPRQTRRSTIEGKNVDTLGVDFGNM